VTREEIDWPVIKIPSITFIVVLLLSLGMIVGSWTFKEDMLSKYKKDKNRFTLKMSE